MGDPDDSLRQSLIQQVSNNALATPITSDSRTIIEQIHDDSQAAFERLQQS